MKISIKIKKLHKDAKIPLYATEHSAAFDLYSIESVIINPNETKIISTGISMEIPEGKVGLIWDRSGLGSKGIHRFAGVIDSDYRGEWKIVLHNRSSLAIKINIGDRIAQAIIQDYYKSEFIEDELSETKRDQSGFGSTGQ